VRPHERIQRRELEAVSVGSRLVGNRHCLRVAHCWLVRGITDHRPAGKAKRTTFALATPAPVAGSPMSVEKSRRDSRLRAESKVGA
jgi:hypothetical protein